MAWMNLIVAGIFEIGWAIGLKYTQGFTRVMPSIATVGAMIVSFALLSRALKTIPVGTAYAVWTGIGATGTAIPMLGRHHPDWNSTPPSFPVMAATATTGKSCSNLINCWAEK